MGLFYHGRTLYRKLFTCSHIQDDWVLIYKIDKNVLTLVLSETGTHADIFE